MPIDKATLAQRVSQQYSNLCLAAKDLNFISDELGKSITEVDAALKTLNLGISVWVTTRKDEGTPDESWYWREEIGYAKAGANWGICLRRVNGDYQDPDESEEEDRWLFNDAPRSFRLAAIERIPELFERLSDEAIKTTKEVRTRLDDVQVVAEAIKKSANETGRLPQGPMIFRPLSDIISDGPSKLDIKAIEISVTDALFKGGHASASQLLSAARWTLDDGRVRIEVPAIGKKMLTLTVNAAAERLIKTELQRLGAPTEFLVLPEAGVASAQNTNRTVKGDK